MNLCVNKREKTKIAKKKEDLLFSENCFFFFWNFCFLSVHFPMFASLSCVVYCWWSSHFSYLLLFCEPSIFKHWLKHDEKQQQIIKDLTLWPYSIFFSHFFQLHQINGLFTSLFTAFKSDLLALFLIKLIYLQFFHNKSFFFSFVLF